MPFVKLDTKVLTSSLWVERDMRSLFFTALLMAEPYELLEPAPQLEVRSLEDTGWLVPPGWYGFVGAAGTGIIRQDGIEMEEGLSQLERLSSPDPDSRSQEYDGRRIARINGGYIVLNYFKYRDYDHTAADRMRRLRIRKKADRLTSVTSNVDDVTRNVTHSREQSTESRVQSKKPSARKAARGVDNSADAFSLAPYLDAYQERFPGSSVPGGRFGKTLKALEAKHGADETLRRWMVFLQEKGELGPEYFARTWSEWGSEASTAEQAWDDMVAILPSWRQALWSAEDHALLDAGSKAGISKIGGFQAIAGADEIGRKSLRKQFIAAYRAASNGGK